MVKKNREINTSENEEDNDFIHFIGNIILREEKEDVLYDVIDGQQRLITFFILLSVLYRKLSDKDPDEKNAKKEIG